MPRRAEASQSRLVLTIAGALDGFALAVRAEPIAPGVARAVLTLTRATPAPPPRLTIRWFQPSVDMAGMWIGAQGCARS